MIRHPIEISGQKTVYVDCDETLVMSDLSSFSEDEQITIEYLNGPIVIVPNRKNINLLTLFYKLGYTVVIWSATGSDWARAVSEALGLSEMASVYLTKPTFYIDDKPVTEWMGHRRYREAK